MPWPSRKHASSRSSSNSSPSAASPSALAFTADGENVLFASNISGQFNLWRVGVEGGWPGQLTAFTDDTVRGVAVNPVDGRILVFADHDGDEFHQIYMLDAEGGWPQKLTDEPQVQHFVGGSAWSPDGTKFAYAANARKPTDMEIWIRDADTGETRPVFGEEMFSFPIGWSPDGTKLVALEFRNNSDSSLHLIDLETDESRDLTPHEDEALYFAGPGRATAQASTWSRTPASEFRGLAVSRHLDRRYEWVEEPRRTSRTSRCPRTGGCSRGSSTRTATTGSGSAISRRAGSSRSRLPAGARPHLTGAEPPLALAPTARRVALILPCPRRPPDVWVVETATGRTRTVTDSRIGGLSEDDLVEIELVSYPSFDGRDIPAWLYRPDVEGKVPVVVAIHGGPEAQEKAVYQPVYQYLLSRGIGVLATNIRGSTGYGKSYQRLIQRDWGGGDMQDWEHAVKWLRDQDWVDSERIGVFGGSYGGFAVLTCVTRLPDYWAAAVDIFGPSNLVTFAKAVPPTWKRFIARFVGDPETEADFLMERSPITYVENVKAPLLVIQGATDPRVVKGESRSAGREAAVTRPHGRVRGLRRRRSRLHEAAERAEGLSTSVVG